jgi:hypothetical protein
MHSPSTAPHSVCDQSKLQVHLAMSTGLLSTSCMFGIGHWQFKSSDFAGSQLNFAW